MKRYFVVKTHRDSPKEEVHHEHTTNHNSGLIHDHRHPEREVFKELPESHKIDHSEVKFDQDFIEDFLLVKSVSTSWSKNKLEHMVNKDAKLKDRVQQCDILPMLACIVHMELNHKIQVAEEDLHLIHKLACNHPYMHMVHTDMANDIHSNAR